jgi:hypothetical protein
MNRLKCKRFQFLNAVLKRSLFFWIGSPVVALLLQLSGAAAGSVDVKTRPVPAKSTWFASASGEQSERNGPELAIDNDPETRWSSPFADGHWLQIDLQEPATLTGAVLSWEAAYAGKYRILHSDDGETWKVSFSTEEGDGQVDQLYFAPTTSRYWRIVCDERATGWGASLWEIDLLGPDKQPNIVTSSSSETDKSAMLMDGDLQTIWQGDTQPEQSIDIDLRREFNITGVRIDWGTVYCRKILLESSQNGQDWLPLADVSKGIGKFDLLVGEEQSARYLRLKLSEPSHTALSIAIREISVRSPGEAIGPTMRYQGAAKKYPPGFYPDQARRRQTYWTVVGLPRDTEESLFDEYGSIEARTGSPMLMPYLLTAGGQLVTAADVEECKQSLAENWLPLPKVVWRTESTELSIEAVPGGIPGASANFFRYRITNSTDRRQTGTFFLAARPHQVNPRWQHGGIAPIHNIHSETLGESQHDLSINGETVYVVLDEPSGFGAAAFDSSRGDVVRFLAKGALPESASAEDEGGLASAVYSFDYDLPAGSSRAIVVAVPLHENARQVASILQDDGPSLGDPTAAFDRLKESQLAMWRDRLAKVLIQVSDPEVTDTLRAQGGYILINQDGDAIQPGSRNYNRSWIRDGSLTATALMRLGLFDETRRYIEWYSQRVADNGLVPPIIHSDGSRYSGYGEIEYDAQGQFVFVVVNYYRLTGDEGFLREHFDRLVSVMRHTAELCDQTRRPDHMTEEPARDRFRGLLPPSISHEGYATPVHSYWDDYWALKGWLDLGYVASKLDRPDVVQWAKSEYEELAAAVQATIDATVAYKKIDFLPSSADYGDPDPTSISIGIYPCEQLKIMRPDLLANTYNQYFDEVERRTQPGAKYGYTPYEIRNLMSFALLNQPERAEKLLNFLMLGRRPVGWRHFAEVVHSDPRLGSYIGDMPHTWVGSGFVNTILGMIFVEQEEQLRLLVASPQEWLSGDGVKLRNVPTRFGKLDLDAQLADDALEVEVGGKLKELSEIHLSWPWASRPRVVTVDGQSVLDFEDGGISVSPTSRRVSVQW